MNWLADFLNIKCRRAATDETMMRAYIGNLDKVRQNVRPDRVCNYDETNLTDNPGRKKLLVKRGCKYPQRVLNSSKATISLMIYGSGSGECLPPYVVYRAQHMWDLWTGL